MLKEIIIRRYGRNSTCNNYSIKFKFSDGNVYTSYRQVLASYFVEEIYMILSSFNRVQFDKVMVKCYVPFLLEYSRDDNEQYYYDLLGEMNVNFIEDI